MTLENPMTTIRDKQYPEPSMDRMKRKAVKKLNPILERVKGEDLEGVWELVGLLVPGLPVSTLDDLDLGECKQILEDSGIMKFSGKDATDADGEDDAEDGITPGESSALTNS